MTNTKTDFSAELPPSQGIPGTLDKRSEVLLRIVPVALAGGGSVTQTTQIDEWLNILGHEIPIRRLGVISPRAGFVDVEVQPAAITRQFASVDAAVKSMQESSALVRELLSSLGGPDQERALAELRRGLSEFVHDDQRCVVPGEALLGVAHVA